MAEDSLLPVNYRAGTAAAGVRDWVLGLTPWSLFDLSDVPGPRQVVAKTLSQMARLDPAVERVAKGVYIRVDNPWRKGTLVYDRARVAMAMAGPGSGYGALTAVNKVGWNWQPTVKLKICVVGRAPRAKLRFCEFVSRSNEARRGLTWAEVSLLEALRFSAYAGWDWDSCIEIVNDGTAVSRLGAGALIRSEALRDVGERERGVNDLFRRRLRSLAAAMPATVSHPGTTPNAAA